MGDTPRGEGAARATAVREWLSETPRTDENGTANLQVKLGRMHCSFCVGTITKAVGRLDGVEQVSVSLAHEEGLVRYRPETITAAQIVATLRQIGYSVRDPRKVAGYEAAEAELAEERNRFLAGLATTVITLGLMIAMWTGHAPVILVAGNLVSIGPWITLGFAAAMMFVVARPVLTMAWQSLRRGIFNQHVLLEAGAIAGMVGGLLGLFVAPALFPPGEFFAVTVFITSYHLLSGFASSLVRNRSAKAVRALLDLQPDTARLIRDGAEADVPVEDVLVGDRVRARPGERIPLDGIVVSGHATVDESMVTGEPTPIQKNPDGEVIGGSVTLNGALVVEVTRVGEDTFLAQVARHIEEARALRPGIVQLVDRILAVYVPTVLGFAGLAILVWTLGAGLVLGQFDVARGIFAALAVLVLGYPCALGMATPLAMMRGGGMAAEKGILMRSGEAFQVFGDVTRVVFDKTGTLTAGRPTVTDLIPAEGVDPDQLLQLAAAAESASEHPLARAVLDAALDRGIDYPDPDDFDSVTGHGVRARIDGATVRVGRPDWVIGTADELTTALHRLASTGRTVIAVAHDEMLLGLVGIVDDVKPDAAETVTRLRRAGIEPVMLTGDDQRTAAAVAAVVGITDYRARLLPGEKAAAVRELQAAGHRVVMVGDGINDAPGLAQADIGIAIGAGTDIAIESSDIVLIGNRLAAVADARDIGTESFRKTKQNLTVAFIFNGIGVPLAVTGLIGPTWAMIAMIASVSTVLINSFGTRLRPNTLVLAARWLTTRARSLGLALRSAAAGHVLRQASTRTYLIMVAAPVVAGLVFTALGGNPVLSS